MDLPKSKSSHTKFQLDKIDEFVAKDALDKFDTSVGSYFMNHKIANKITQIYSDSATYDYSSLYKKVDLIFIDAAHDYENKKTDTENALKMLADNGVILWDNYDDILNPDVTKYLGEIAEVYPLYHLRGTPMVVYWNKKRSKPKK